MPSTTIALQPSVTASSDPRSTPNWGSAGALPRHQRGLPPLAPLPQRADARNSPVSSPVVVTWAKHQDEVRAVQRLRYIVFALEMGANLKTPNAHPVGLDIDDFDDYCEHLIIRCRVTDEVIGTYRVLTPVQAQRLGRWYADTEFDLSACGLDREGTLELGRSCVHPEHRSGLVLMALWQALFRFAFQQGLHTLLGCTSISLNSHGSPDVAGVERASALFRQLEMYCVAPERRAIPLLPLPLVAPASSLPLELPPLLRGYLRLGARVLGAPCWDPAFNVADLPMQLKIQDLPHRFKREYYEHV